MNGLNPFFLHQDIAIGYGEGQSRTMCGRIYVNLESMKIKEGSVPREIPLT